MKNLDARPGFYGKIPSRGDFVTRRLTAEFIETWDPWLQSGLCASKEQLGDQWLERYLTGPIWYFVLSPGLCDTSAWAGVLMPSVDKVGRYFPLTLAAPVAPDLPLAKILLGGRKWFGAMEQLALAALEDELDLADLDRRLTAQPLQQYLTGEADVPRDSHCTFDDGHLNFYAVCDSLEKMTDGFVPLACCLLSRTQPTFSIWRTGGSDTSPPCLRVYHRLPRRDAFSQLLAAAPKRPRPLDDPLQADINQIEDEDEISTAVRYYPGPEPHPPAAVPVTPLPPPVQADEGKDPGDHQLDEFIKNSTFRWQSSAATTVGKIRKINEDAYLEHPQIGLWAVADGMGGHHAGDIASRTVINTLGTLAPTGSLETFCAYAVECLRSVNQELHQLASKFGQDRIVGTTVVVMLAVGRRCAAIWAGDSRLYQLRAGVLTQLTRDHSLVAELSQEKQLEPDAPLPESAAGLKHVVTRALGGETEIELETAVFEARENDRYLLCSDGLIGELSPREIGETMGRGNCRVIARNLINRSLERGAEDNVTVVVAGLGPAGKEGG